MLDMTGDRPPETLPHRIRALPRRAARVGLVALLTACGPTTSAESNGSSEGTTEPSTTAGATTTGDATAVITTGSPSTSSISASTTAADTTVGDTTGPSFPCPPSEEDLVQCSPFDQDCPEGFKCLPHGDEQGPPSAVCTPVVDGPSGLFEECSTNADTCSDSCAGMTGCRSLFGDEPMCFPMCGNIECPEGQLCLSCGSCNVGLCVPGCDPLDPVCPEALPTCILRDDGFMCVTPIPEGGLGVGEDCSGAAADICMSGLLCIAAEAVGPECPSIACCSELCDVNDPGVTCTNPAHVCQAVFPEEPPPGQEHVGVCALPGA